ncbi:MULTISPECIES: DNA-binding domain-containing protein [unclassified Sinorhizobium]|uniref:DNA-binding domain-containing protein n=1 Tax=unclassified Sinorhizobium TaxID=2613772 RepID=UPI0024C39B4F|nr:MULTISPECIES: DNA-binding domain-containing protein [unclassified Sinorhizobium]MDK1378394.1 DNA-binding domain-containing protein [Sinorhizobium sp. 6-70]MDK1482634.1 DNA-binding domain-containing protein [Sinorhizobium sp. 6-117]MDK1482637.1 DNA-binding domain-containing protein [Sinorhizobium sp. 6-117]
MRAARDALCATADDLGYPERLVPALLDPGRATPTVVAGPMGKAADKRFDIYRNNVTVSLIDALAAAFPATMRITGETFFRAMARFYVRETPPTSPLLFEYGRDLPAFIERYEYAQSMPWLADVARIERAWLDAYHAADAPVLSPHALTSFPADALADTVFETHPSAHVVRSAYPAVTIFSVNRDSGPVGRIEAREPESALITRPALDVEVRRLPPGADVFLGNLLSAEPLGSAAAAASAHCPEFDLATAIAVMLEAGAFAAVR